MELLNKVGTIEEQVTASILGDVIRGLESLH